MNAVGTRIRLDFGSIEVLGYERTEGGGWWRRERYTPDDGKTCDGRPYVDERSFAASDSDVSVRWRIYPDYDSRCGCCWLNFTHTRDVHARRVDEHEAARRKGGAA